MSFLAWANTSQLDGLVLLPNVFPVGINMSLSAANTNADAISGWSLTHRKAELRLSSQRRISSCWYVIRRLYTRVRCLWKDAWNTSGGSLILFVQLLTYSESASIAKDPSKMRRSFLPGIMTRPYWVRCKWGMNRVNHVGKSKMNLFFSSLFKSAMVLSILLRIVVWFP